MKRENLSTKFPIASKLPEFSLKNIDNSFVDSAKLELDKGLLVVFSCNHCPYVKGSDDMLIEIARKFQSEGLQVLVISSNDSVKYPEDSFEKMQEKAATLDLPYPYLFDETQEVAKLFDAACTPESYLFDASKSLVYHGAISDSPKDPGAVNEVPLKKAIEQLLVGESVVPSYVHPVGCSIKWI